MSRVFLCKRGIDNGFAQQSLTRLKNIMLYIIGLCGEVFYTKMNKLLFYADFMAYRTSGYALSGLSYKAIDYGPVPERWDRVYSQFDEILQEPRSYGDKEGSVLTTTAKADLSIFTPEELLFLEQVCARFADCTSSDMTRISHEESAWIDYVRGYERISFESAFKLKAI